MFIMASILIWASDEPIPLAPLIRGDRKIDSRYCMKMTKLKPLLNPPSQGGFRGISTDRWVFYYLQSAMSQSENLIGSEFYLPYDRNLLDRAKEMRRRPTPAERKLWEGYLKSFRVRVLRQRPFDYLIVDFFCARRCGW